MNAKEKLLDREFGHGLAPPKPGKPYTSISHPPGLLPMAYAMEALWGGQASHRRPDFRIDSIVPAGASRPCAVREVALDIAPFGTLLHFRKESGPLQPRVLLAAPMSGHYATQLREAVLALLPEHDVYLTDWHDAHDVPLDAGAFGMDEYIGYLVRHLELLGPRAHLVAICQSCVPAVAAAALLAEDDHPARPRSLTLMAGPIDARINPTVVNRYATGAPLEWFERNLISTVPQDAAGAGRPVYAAGLQLLSSFGMHWQRWMESMCSLWLDGRRPQQNAGEMWRMVHDEYLAAQDIAAEFYMDNLRLVFRDYALPQGRLRHGERLLRPECISDIALLTVEAERDDICGAGQTKAAHALCGGIAGEWKFHHVEPEAGHKDVFTGSHWQQGIFPVLRAFMGRAQAMEARS